MIRASGARGWGWLVAGVGLLLAVPAWASATSDFPWGPPDVEQARALAAERGVKLVVVVSTSWCEPCRRLKARVFATDDMRDAASRFLAIEIDAESPKGRPFAERYEVKRYPTTLFLDAEGNEETRVVGFRELPGFMHVVNQWLAGKAQAAAPGGGAALPLAQRWALAFGAAYDGKPQAEAALRAVIAADVGDEEGLGGLARLALAERVQLGRGEAKQAAAELAKLRTELAGTRAARLAVYPHARALAAMGKPERGQAELMAHAKSRPDDRDALYGVARFVWEHEAARPDAALKAARAGLKRHADFDELWELVGRIEQRRGQAAAAREAFARAAELRPDLPLYAKRLAEVPSR